MSGHFYWHFVPVDDSGVPLLRRSSMPERRLLDALGRAAQYEPVSLIRVSAADVSMLAAEQTEALLRAFARWCPLSVTHMWDMPDFIRHYLETGDGDEETRGRVFWFAMDRHGLYEPLSARCACKAAKADIADPLVLYASFAAEDTARAIAYSVAEEKSEVNWDEDSYITAKARINERLEAMALEAMGVQP